MDECIANDGLWLPSPRHGLGAAPPQEIQRKDQRHDQQRQRAELDDEVAEDFLILVGDLRELRREHQHAPDSGDQPDEQERLGDDRMFAERNLNRIQKLDEQQDQQNTVEQRHDLLDEIAGYEIAAEIQHAGDEQNDRAARQQHSETDINDVLDEVESARDPVALRLERFRHAPPPSHRAQSSRRRMSFQP